MYARKNSPKFGETRHVNEVVCVMLVKELFIVLHALLEPILSLTDIVVFFGLLENALSSTRSLVGELDESVSYQELGTTVTRITSEETLEARKISFMKKINKILESDRLQVHHIAS